MQAVLRVVDLALSSRFHVESDERLKLVPPSSTVLIRIGGLDCVPDTEDAGRRDLRYANPDPLKHPF
jgi:hypothetical protein